MKKLLTLMLCVTALPAMANSYGEYADPEFEEETFTDDAPTAEPCPACPACPVCNCAKDTHETYIGIRFYKNAHSTYSYNFPGGQHDVYNDDGFGFGTVAGNRLTNYARIEYETLYMGTKYSNSTSNSDYDLWANFANAYLFYDFDGAIAPYVGLGLGLTGIWGEINGDLDSDFDLSYQAMTGIMFELNSRISLDIGFRYTNFGRVKHADAVTKVDATQLYMGASYKFGL